MKEPRLLENHAHRADRAHDAVELGTLGHVHARREDGDDSAWTPIESPPGHRVWIRSTETATDVIGSHWHVESRFSREDDAVELSMFTSVPLRPGVTPRN